MGERDFLRWISANDALLAIAALAMMQRKEERGGRPSIIYHAAIICLGGCGEERGGWRWMEWPEGFRIANNFILD